VAFPAPIFMQLTITLQIFEDTPCTKGFSKLEKICRKYKQNFLYALLSVAFIASIFTTFTNTVWLTSDMIFIQLHSNVSGKSKSRVKIPIFL
jgi:hypothetical protein